MTPEAQDRFKKQRLGIRELNGGFTPVHLPLNGSGPDSQQVFHGRHSIRRFALNPIPIEQVSKFLGCLRQVEHNGAPKHLYASAGGLYPVQTYLHVKPGRVTGLPSGVFYYHPLAHRLISLAPDRDLDREIHEPFVNRHVYDEAAFSLFLIADMKAIVPIYAEQARDFCLFEAGYMSQLLMMTAAWCRLGLCPIGKMDFKRIGHLFALDETHEFLHSFLGGALDEQEPFPETPAGGNDEEKAMHLLRRIRRLSGEEIDFLLEANGSAAGLEERT